ncbi:DUF503 domain-containing protein [Alkalihalobacterium bogoriense]|uniref:DUF503 domain-containing protein n=1 Tax=Alkalihalobacterium bogoriense TaxID=246272 RepID=UPI00047BAB48|nr:DUF503 family protein [Alkalihalobacterium bogoriense]
MIGVVYCELYLYSPQSLKEKRSITKSLITRLKQRFNVSVSEIGYQDVWQRCELAIVTVASDKTVAEKELGRAMALVDSTPELERTVTSYEWL